MKVFISSTVRGLEAFREAATKAARTLKHDVIRAEDFSASPDSPQRVCLAGVRKADVTVLILGARYGDPQASGLSPTHEEYREARDRGGVLVFIQEGVKREARQDEFVKEVQTWARGHFTATFSTPEDLRDAVTSALHEVELNRKVGSVDEAELVERGRSLLPDHRGVSSTRLAVVLTSGPRQQILRPSELDKPALIEAIEKAALFGATQIFDRKEGTESKLKDHQLIVEQPSASVVLTGLGDIVIVQSIRRDANGMNYMPVLIQEDVQAGIERALRFGLWWFDHVDPKGRLETTAAAASLAHAGYLSWQTRAEWGHGRNSVTMGIGGDRPVTVTLSPPSRSRAMFAAQPEVIAEDLTVLLRREAKG